MTNTEFKTKLTNAFNTHMFMDKRNKHTVNELLYVLWHDHSLNYLGDCNISICKQNGEWWSIPSLDSFVSIPVLSVWFEDDKVEFEVEMVGKEKYNCITVYECESEED